MAPKWRQNTTMPDDHRLNLRLPDATWSDIDVLRQTLPGKVSRNTWIATAIQEKIARDKVTESPAQAKERDHA